MGAAGSYGSVYIHERQRESESVSRAKGKKGKFERVFRGTNAKLSKFRHSSSRRCSSAVQLMGAAQSGDLYIYKHVHERIVVLRQQLLIYGLCSLAHDVDLSFAVCAVEVLFQI